MEGQTEQAALIEVVMLFHDLGSNIKKRLGADFAILDDFDAAELFGNEYAVITWRLDHHKRCIDARHEWFEFDLDFGLCNAG